MANPFTGTAAAFSPIDYLAPDVAESQRQLARQQAMVDLLRQRALEDDSQTQMVSGWAIPNSGVKPFEKLANALMAGKMQQGVDAKQAAISQRLAQKLTGQAAEGLDPATLQQGAVMDMYLPGSGAAFIRSKLEEGKPTDDVRDARQFFPNDLGRQQAYLASLAAKNTSQTFTPGSVVTSMSGTTNVPMSEYQKQQLENEQERLGLSERSTAASELSANTAALNAGGGGGFGNSESGRAMNMWRDLTLKLQSGQELTPAEKVNLALAERQLMRPQVVGSPDTGISILQPNPLPTMGAPATAPPTAAPMSPTSATPPAAPAAEAPQVTTPAVSAPVPLTQPRTEQKILDEARANAKLALPDIEDDTTKAISEVDNLLNDPNLNALIGNPAGFITKRIAGQPAADVDAKLQQIKGGAFLAAIEKLKGSGAVSEPEGKSATAAQNRMAEAQSVPAFREAALEYKEILRKGLKRAREKAGVGAEASSAPIAGAGGTLTPEEQTEREMLLQKLEQMRNQR